MRLKRLLTRRVDIFGFRMNPLLELLGMAAVVAVFFVTLIDKYGTLDLIRNRWHPLTDLVGRTVFEGQAFGIGDLSVMALLIVLTAYLLSGFNHDSIHWLKQIRCQLGFILTAAVVTCLCTVHGLKTILGRARPERVFVGGRNFTEWFEFGVFQFPASAVSGSFPSGHTALAFVFMAFAYALFGDPSASPRQRQVGMAFGTFAFANAVLVGIGRIMSMSHWISDCLASVILSWIIIHCLYYFVMDVPSRTRRLAGIGPPLQEPLFWELRLIGWMLFFSTGLIATFSGLRSAGPGGNLQLIGLVPVGTVMILWGRRRILSWISLTRHTAVNLLPWSKPAPARNRGLSTIAVEHTP